MFSEQNGSNIGPQSSASPGVYLLNSAADSRFSELQVKQYRLNVNGGLDYDDDRQKFTSTVAYYLSKQHGVPVAAAGELQVVTVGSLTRSVKVWGRTVTAEEVEESPVVLEPSSQTGNQRIKSLIYSDVRRAIQRDKYDFHGFRNNLNDIEETDPAFGQNDYAFAGHRRYDLSVEVTADGEILLHIELKHRIRSTDTIADRYNPGDDLPRVKVVHDTNRYDKSGRGTLLGWSEYSYTDTVDGVGDSIASLHEGVAEESLRNHHIKKDTQLVKLTYNGREERHQLPHLLKLSPRKEVVAEFDPEFAKVFQRRTANLPAERAKAAQEFIQELPRLPSLNIEFHWGPANLGFRRVNCREGNTRLMFGGGSKEAMPKQGLVKHGVYDAPDDCTVTMLCPERFDNVSKEFPPLVTESLRKVGSPGGVRCRSYQLGSDTGYSRVWEDLPPKTDVGLVVVPDKNNVRDFPGIDDPYQELKRTLMRKGVPTQMVQKSTTEAALMKGTMPLPQNVELLNVLSGLIAKAGGTPWQISQLPGETDAFLGLDVAYDGDTGAHTGASASIVLNDGTTFAAESVTQQSGESFTAEHVVQFVRDLASDLTEELGIEPSRLCLLRDGKVTEDTDSIREGLAGLSADLDIVGVRKSGQPRVAEFDGTSFGIAPKGYAFVDGHREQAVVHSFGKPELKDGNSSGTPRTLRLVKDGGPTDIETLARQAYWLSEMHVGSAARSTRLPVPVHYADKAAAFVSDGFAQPGEIIHGPAFI